MTSLQSQTGRLVFVLGCVSAAIGVAAGAFGAHGLKTILSFDMLSTYETAVRYQIYHAFGLMLAGVAGLFSYNIKWAAWCFAVGTVLFSGSLYVLTLTGMRWLGAVTPFGGVAFIAAWLLLAFSIIRNNPS